ncbi:MAG: MBL fold metallo-hydrolase [Sphingomonadales bacterium]|nr:MBL fold metallo-hydrolase [Sphingomonadales bacterium]
MKISFHGAARTVTGSKHLVELSDGKKILLDCGLFQGLGKDTDRFNRHFGFDPKTVDVLLLSHAHIDHCGLIPRLITEGFRGKIWCTPATRALASVLLEDSAKIQEDEIRYVNKRRRAQGLPLLQPLYTVQEAGACAIFFEEVDYNQWAAVLPGVQVQFTDTGHIIGSAAVHVRYQEGGQNRQLSFSGDVGRYGDAILRPPASFSQADLIILESTYGSSLHPLHVTTPDLLLQHIEETCLQRKGKLVIAAFSVGRTQELLYFLNQLEVENRLPAVPVYLDSPLSVEATEIVKSFPAYFNKTIQRIMQSDADPFGFPQLKYIRTVEQSKQLNFENGPMVIIAASGMADAGRVKHHISNTVENSRNRILFTGYCEPRSLGGRLLSGLKEVNIYGVAHEVHASIEQIRSMSAHGDYDDLCQWLSSQDPNKVRELFLVHGEYPVQQDFRDRLIKKGFDSVKIPEMHSVFGA